MTITKESINSLEEITHNQALKEIKEFHPEMTDYHILHLLDDNHAFYNADVQYYKEEE